MPCGPQISVEKRTTQQPSLQGLSPVLSSPFVSANLILFLAQCRSLLADHQRRNNHTVLRNKAKKGPCSHISGSRAHLSQNIPVLEHRMALLTHHITVPKTSGGQKLETALRLSGVAHPSSQPPRTSHPES